ncbi:hypothetical protein APHAL10511_006327 [Amanita phalloides]|nr:hypothetical protein APHAL10511_006327 [Amanita phalloides]
MKLDATDLRYVTSDEFRVLTAVEIGSKNHEVVPTALIAQISGLRSGGVNKLISSLAKRNLVSKMQNSKYDGYRLTYGGYDYLAMRAMSKRGTLSSVGNQIGVGKESDIYIVADDGGNEIVLKLHRLGRTSFRTIKKNRDYLGKRKSASWMYMSRLAAQKEYAFMQVLFDHGFPVPRPIDQARHCILMELIDAYPLRQITEVSSPGKLYSALMELIVRFAKAGLIHGDFNEFNILIRRDSGDPVVIDFPQMVSTSHENAAWYFNRDVDCIRNFFRRRFQYESSLYPRFSKVLSEDSDSHSFRLDVVVEASGFGRKDMRILEEYMETIRENQTSSDSEEEIIEEDDGSESVSCESVSSTDDIPDVDMSAGTPKAELAGSKPGTTSMSPPRDVSRSPPQSRSVSPATLGKMMDGLDLNEIKSKVASDLSKNMSKQRRKYHSKRAGRKAGRAQGSKAKQDTRVKVDRHGVWGYCQMDKTDLEAYQVQLSQVELALSADPDSAELASLRSELKELIELAQAAVAQAEAASSSKSDSSRKASSTPTHVWSAGAECLAKYSTDGQWYPARITSLGGSAENRVYSIVFKGYNTTELVKSTDLKPLPPNYAATIPSSSTKRKLTKVEEEERERKKKKNEKKLEARAAKAKEQQMKQATWQKFAKKSEKKGVHIAGVAGTSIFRTPDNPMGKVGVTGSGKGMTEVALRTKHKFAATDEDQ